MKLASATLKIQLVSTASMLAVASASAGENVLLAPQRNWIIELHVNGAPTGIITELTTDARGCPVVSVNDLRRAGIDITGGGEVCLVDVSGVDYEFNEQDLLLNLYSIERVDAQTPAPTRLEIHDLSPTIAGAVVDYGLTGQVIRQNGEITTTMFGDLSASVTSDMGSVRSTIIASDNGDDSKIVRLETVYEKEFPDSTARLTIGDSFTKAPQWGRTSTFAGIQYGTDFSLRPGELKRPYKTFQTLLREQAELEVVVNGVSQGSRTVGPGIQNIIPEQVDGLNQVEIRIRDGLGVERVEELEFVSSRQSLAKGVTEYAASVGVPRKFDGLKNSYEDQIVANGMVRRGVSDQMTVEGYTELSEDTQVIGVGAQMLVGTIGSANLAVSTSQSKKSGGGEMVQAGFRRQTNSATFSAQVRIASPDYADTLSTSGVEYPDQLIRASAGIRTGIGSIGLSYNEQRDKVLPNRKFLSTNWNHNIGDRMTMFATGFTDFLRDETGVTLGVRVPFGSHKVRASAESIGGKQRQTIVANRTRRPGEAVQWRASYSGGDGPSSLRADANVTSRHGDLYASAGKIDGTEDAIVGFRGGVVVVKGKPHLTRDSGEAYAVVDVGGLPDTMVYQDNRPIGRTDNNGKIIVTRLRPYERNVLSVDPDTIPLTHTLATKYLEITPTSGATEAAFDIDADNSLSFTILDTFGDPLMPGAVAYLQDKGARSLVGYGGRVSFADADDTDSVKVVTPDGTFYADVDYIRETGTMTLIPTLETNNEIHPGNAGDAVSGVLGP